MSESLKPCPFCGTKPEIEVSAFYWPSSCYVDAEVYCPKCQLVTNNLETRKDRQVQQSVFWTDKEILKHVPDGMQLKSDDSDFDATTAKAAEAEARRTVIEMWQQRIE